MRTSARLGFLLGLFVVLFGGAVAGWFVGGVVPAAIRDGRIELRSEPYVGAWGSAPFEIDDARRLPIPFTFADFDMQLEVELGEGAIVDLVVRRVEPRVIGSEIVPFHGRFSVLRLSADRAGPPWLSRTEALLGDRGAGGVDLAPGHTATVWLRGRGRWLEANVAGRRLPRFLAEDEFGSFLVVARGGRAVVRSVAITPVPRAAPWLATRGGWVGLGLLLGALAAAVLAATTVRHFLWHALGTAVLTAFGAWLVTRQTGLPLQQPPAGALFALLGAGGAIGLSAAPRRALLLLAAALLLATMPSLRADESALDEVFGPAAGSQLAEAEAQLLRGPYTIHDARSADYRVFLLGGQLLYGRAHESAAPEEHLEVLLAGDLQVALDLAAPRRVDVPCLATENAHAAQQWDVFRRFYTGYRPGVIVFGVSSFELDAAPASTAASHVESLGRTLTAVADYCAEHGIGLVLLADPGLPGVFRAALDRIAARGCPLVEIAAGEAPTSISKRLTAAIAPLLRP